jgi:hypothetical protein
MRSGGKEVQSSRLLGMSRTIQSTKRKVGKEVQKKDRKKERTF